MRVLIKRAGLLVLTLFAVAGLYVLSIGPALRLFAAGILPEDLIELWEPVRLLCDPGTRVGKVLIRYQSWWTGEKEPGKYPPPPLAVLPEPSLTMTFPTNENCPLK